MKTLADRFDYLGQLFIDFDSDENKVSMGHGVISDTSECGTLACCGGYAWLFHILGVLPISEKASKKIKERVKNKEIQT